MTLHQVIIATFAYYHRGQTLDDMVLAMYVEDLNDLDPQVVIAGYQQYRRNPKNRTFPLPAEIRELVAPGEFIAVETQAREIASRIVGAISMYGWNNSTQAQLYIGPVGWGLVERSGGWSHLCQNTGVTIQPTTLTAQLRDQLEGTLRYGQAAIEERIQAAPAARIAPPRLVLQPAPEPTPPPTKAEMVAELIRGLANKELPKPEPESEA
jgi:hypothetical protein